MVIQLKGPLESEIPLPSLLQKNWPLIVIDLKDCFFTIHLQEKDRENLPSQCLLIIILSLLGRYQWTILPQRMLNSPTLCQYFVSQPLEIIRKQFPKSTIYHYMNDILSWDINADTLKRMFEE